MTYKPAGINWPKAIQPLLEKYRDEKHPLSYRNHYQLLVMVLLSAQDSDKHINALAPALFEAFPDMPALAKATQKTLLPYIESVKWADKKLPWLLEIGKTLQTNRAIPMTLDGLTALPGIGRKSANVILREAGKPAEGIIVDLHVLRVAPRLGIATGTDPKRIEAQLMKVLPQKQWDAGMAMSFLGREICRPSKPHCPQCLMRGVCKYYHEVIAPAS